METPCHEEFHSSIMKNMTTKKRKKIKIKPTVSAKMLSSTMILKRSLTQKAKQTTKSQNFVRLTSSVKTPQAGIWFKQFKPVTKP
jgi:hypothetical protein